MPNMGFRLRDYSTGALIGLTGSANRAWVFVGRRPNTLPPLSEQVFSSWRPRDRRNFFETRRNRAGDVVVPDVPVGTYETRLFVPSYVPVTGVYASPMNGPIEVPMHRDATYPFGAGDTLFRGEVTRAVGGPHSGFDVELIDPEPLVPNHRVPLNARGQFVIFVPEKETTGGVAVRVFHSTGNVTVNIPTTALRRVNIVPAAVVP